MENQVARTVLDPKCARIPPSILLDAQVLFSFAANKVQQRLPKFSFHFPLLNFPSDSLAPLEETSTWYFLAPKKNLYLFYIEQLYPRS